MRTIRHLIAIAILAGLYHLYHQNEVSRPTSADTANAYNPFSDWHGLGEAPSFNASSSQAGNAPAFSEPPAGLNHPQLGDLNVIADLTNWKNQTQQDLQQQYSQTRNSVQQSVDQLADVPQQIWQEPGIQSRVEQARQLPQQLTGSTQQKAQQLQNQIETQYQNLQSELEGTVSSVSEQLQKPIDEIERQQSQLSQTYQQAQQKLNDLASQTRPSPLSEIPVQNASHYREFSLGSGEEKTVCVIDQSVSENGLLLSQLYSGLRRDWAEKIAADPNQSLVLLIADSQQTTDPASYQQAISQRLKQLQPTRVVNLSRGNQSRGSIRFSDDAESIAALLSVPGAYKVQADTAGTNNKNSLNASQVSIELPQDTSTQDSMTLQLLNTALAGDWEQQESPLPFTGQARHTLPEQPANKPKKSIFNPFQQELAQNKSTPANSPESEFQKKFFDQVEEIAPPDVPPKTKPTSEIVKTLPQPQTQQQAAPQNTSSFFQQLYEKTLGQPSRNSSATPQQPSAPQQRSPFSLFLGEPAEFPAEFQPGISSQGSSMTQQQFLPADANLQDIKNPANVVSQQLNKAVELLDAPPSYQPKPIETPQRNSFYRLPPPPQ